MRRPLPDASNGLLDFPGSGTLSYINLLSSQITQPQQQNMHEDKCTGCELQRQEINSTMANTAFEGGKKTDFNTTSLEDCGVGLQHDQLGRNLQKRIILNVVGSRGKTEEKREAGCYKETSSTIFLQ